MIDDSCKCSKNTYKRKMGKMRPIIRYQIRTECNVYKWGHCNSVPSIVCCAFSSDLQILVLTTPSISHTCLDTMYFQYPLFKFLSDKEQVMKIVCTRLHVFCKNVIETHGENADYHFLFVIRQVFITFFIYEM